MTARTKLSELEAAAARPAMRMGPPPPPLSIRRPADVVAVLAEQIELARAEAGADVLDRARTIALLSGVALRAMEAVDGDARLAAIENVLKLRREAEGK